MMMELNTKEPGKKDNLNMVKSHIMMVLSMLVNLIPHSLSMEKESSILLNLL